jgi:hypothetical protein
MTKAVQFLRYQSGVSSVGQYQMSGIPYATASQPVPASSSAPFKIEFPNVTKFVTVVNEATGSNLPLRVGFSVLGVTGTAGGGTDNFFLLDNGESYTGEWRLADIYMLGHAAATTASVIAGLTGVIRGELPLNWSGNLGVG